MKADIPEGLIVSVMAGLVPAIHVLGAQGRRGCPAQGRA
jgi:hypothetical protein